MSGAYFSAFHPTALDEYIFFGGLPGEVVNDGSLHLIVRYWTLPEQAQVRRTKTRAVVAIKAACDRAEIKIPQPVPVNLYELHSSNNSASNSASDA